MNTFITPFADLLLEAEEIDIFLNITASDNIQEIVERGSDLAVYIARTGKMLADAKYWQDIAMNDAVSQEIRRLATEAALPALVTGKMIDAKCKDQNYLVTWVERLNRTATHQLEWCRTLISKAKEEWKYTGHAT